MGYHLRPADRDQLFLLPPSLSDWLPADHLAYFITDVVDDLELDSFYEELRPDGRGGASFDPAMMVALLVYAYCLGVRSSRAIERACQTDIGFRVLSCNQAPDHTTIARFRARHEKALAGLFNSTLSLCARAGMASLGIVALDSTKISAAASLSANRTRGEFEAEVAAMLAEARAIDEAEDAAYGDARGDELPPELRHRDGRRRRIAEMKEALEREKAEQADQKTADYEAKLARRAALEQPGGTKLRGRKPLPPSKQRAGEPRRVNLTDPDSRALSGRTGYLQGYTAQAVANEHQVVIAAKVTNEQNDQHQFLPMLREISLELGAAGIKERPEVLLADAGYLSEANLEALGDADPDCFVATRNLKRNPQPKVSLHGRLPASASRIDKMDRKVSTKAGRAIYRRRQQLIEPVFGQVKEARGIRRFMRRGLTAVDSEWRFVMTTHNLLKLYRRALLDPTTAPYSRLAGSFA